MARQRIAFVMLALAMLAGGLLGSLSQVQAASTDVASPAGPVTGAIVIFSPSILLLTPTPATGSLLVPLQHPAAPGSGASFMQWQLVIPGPNPAQNTTIGLAQLLSTLVGPVQPIGSQAPPSSGTPAPSLVSVFSTSPR